MLDRLFTIFIMILLISGCGATTKPKMSKDTASGYTIVKSSAFSKVLLANPDSLSPYNSIRFLPIKTDNIEVIKTNKYDVDRSWSLIDRDKQRMIESYTRSKERKFNANALFPTQSKQGPGVLNAQIEITGLKPYAVKPGSAGINRTTVAHFGTLYIRILLADSVTGKFVGVIQDGQRLEPTYQADNTMGNFNGAVGRAFDRWMSKLQKEIVAIKS